MAKQLNVNLGFTADTSQAKAQIQQLQRDLKNLTSSAIMESSQLGLTKDLQEATAAAAQLSVQLKNATNVNTGNLDLTRFNESLKASGMSLEKYQDRLYQLGPAGEKAFADLARSITLAEVPMRRSSQLLDNLWTTMKNTARWQLTSSAMHGFMGAVSSAYGYVQDLNASLNDIRIVTGYSSEKMAEFAEEANRAAKMLSTTTTEYTNASLIFYQQGLSDEEVKKRTDITIKMANAAGESAEKVSDQLTAVWNNFYDGTKSLEYYADVMTALGAKTASSTDEIAGGLEKFAAIGETIGLSYEYAASALATITSNTRESEEVVGTALKTIFARIQGLNLGETLDDGTTLNKYSEALQKVGISIFDQAGELKAMDDILDELGAKWNTLNSAQQTALAQTVAGVRQYNQLVALMNNWDSGDSDSFQANLDTARNSQGALQEQADIYAESWEAANDRVRASAEAVYSALLNDEFFIDLTNGFGKLLDGVKSFIDGLGGVKGVLLAIGGIVTRVFSKQIGESLSNMAYSLRATFNPKGVMQEQLKEKERINQLLVSGAKDSGTTSGGFRAEAYTALGQNQLSYIANVEKMSQEEQAVNQILMDRNRQLAEHVMQKGEVVEAIEKEIEAERKSLEVSADYESGKKGKKGQKKDMAAAKQAAAEVKELSSQYEKLSMNATKLSNLSEQLNFDKEFASGTQEAQKLNEEVKEAIMQMANIKVSDSMDDVIAKLSSSFGIAADEAKELWTALNNPDTTDLDALNNKLLDLMVSSTKAANGVRSELMTALKNTGMSSQQAAQKMQAFDAALEKYGPASQEAEAELRKLTQTIKEQNATMDQAAVKPIPLSQALSQAASVAMSVGQAFTTITGIIDVFNDSEATTSEKIMALVSGMGMMIPAIMSVTSAFSTVPIASSAANAAMVTTGQVATTTGTTISVAMWQVTLIVAAVTALVGVVALIATAESKAEKAAKQAAEAAEDLASAADDAKNDLENLQSAFDTYDEAVDKLNACTRGTEEWDAALKNVNSTVLELLSSNSSLMGYSDLFTRNAEGMLEINEAMRATLLTAAEQKVLVTEAAAMFGSSSARDTANQANLEYIGNRFGGKDLAGKSYYTYQDQRYVWGDENSAVSASEEQIKTAYIDVESIIANNLQDLAGLTEQEYRSKMRTLLLEQASDEERASSRYIQLIDSIVNTSTTFQDQINALANSATEAANQLINTARLLADQQLGDRYTGEEKDLASVEMAQLQDKYQKAYLELLTGNALRSETIQARTTLFGEGSNFALGIHKASESNNATYEYILEELKKAGYDYSADTDNPVVGSDTARYFSFVDNATGEKTELKSAAWVAEILATQRALEELGDSASKARETLTHLRKTVDHVNEAEGISGLITNGNLYNLTGEGAESMESAIGDVTSQKDVINYLKKVLGKTEEELMTYFDVDGIDKVFEKFTNAWDDNEDALDDAADGWIESVQRWRDENEAQIKGFTAASQSQIMNSLTEAFTIAGSEGMNALGEVFKAAGSDADDLQDLLNEIDWTDPNAINQLNAAIKEQGFNIDITSEAWQIYIQAMSNAYNQADTVMYKFSSLRDTIASVQQVLNGLEMGSIISDEEYAKLLAINPAIEELFGLAANGYKFLGDTSVLEEMLIGNTKKSIQEVKAEFSSLRDLGSVLMSSKYFDESGDKLNLSLMELVGLTGSLELQDYQEYILEAANISKEALEKARGYLVAQHYGTLGRETTTEEYKTQLGIVQKYYDELQNIRKQYQDGTFEDARAEEVWASSMCSGVRELTNAYQEGIISLETYNKYFNQLASTDLSMLRDTIDTISSGGELSAEQAKYLDALAEQWPELAAAAKQGSDDYVRALRKVEEAIAQAQIYKLIEDQQAIIDVNADFSDADAKMKEFMDRDYQITIGVKTILDTAFSDAVNSLDTLNSMASLIGDNYILAGSDIARVAEVFPGILQGAQDLHDGTVQLNADAVKQYMDAAKDEVIADLTAKKEKMIAAAEIFKAKKEIYRKMADAYHKLASGEVTDEAEAAKLKGEIQGALTDLVEQETAEQDLLYANTAKNQVDQAIDVDTAWTQTTENISNNSVEAYQNAADASIQSGNTQIQVASAVALANQGAAIGNPLLVVKAKSLMPVSNGVNVVFDGGTVPEEERPDIDLNPEQPDITPGADTSELTEKEKEAQEWEKKAAEADAWADYYESLENYYNAAGQQLDVQLGGVNKLFGNIQAGLGEDGKPDEEPDPDEKDERDIEAEKAAVDTTKEQYDVYADIDTKIDEINDKLRDQKQITEHAATEEEKLESLAKEADILKELNDAYAEKEEIAKNTLSNIKTDLQNAAKVDGLDVEINFDGDALRNQVQLYDSLAQQVQDAQIAYKNAIGTEQEEAAKANMQAIENAAERVKELIRQYLETIALLRDIENTIADTGYDIADTEAASQPKVEDTSSSSSSGGGGGGDSGPSLEEIQQAYYKSISGFLEADMAKFERQLDRIDLQLERIADDFYSMAEAAEIMAHKLPIALNSLERYEDFYHQISEDYNSMKITSEDYQAGLEETYDSIIGQLEALIELDKEMMHYYEDTLAAGMDELAKYTDQMDHLNSVLDHYQSIITMINGEDEYESIGIILEGKAHNLQNQMDIAVANYEMLLSQQAAIRAKYDAAEDEAQRELHKAELDAITATVDEAHETMLAKTEEWAEAQKSILENAMAQAAKQLEMAFTNGMGFDTLSSSLSRLSSISDEYYTKTNQIYETQKMLNNLQQEIDKTTNTAAKARLKSYASEIEKLREKNKLSKLDLSIAKAKYDVLLAEIALEEAQNAKATVRLQRDSEGNYGYVYTADQNQIAQAEQKLADAQNALYNVSLEGANNYGQKILELQQQLADDLVSLEEARAAGQFQTDEAYYAAKELLIAEYNELFEAYSDSYNVALLEDLSIQQEAWITTYDDLIQESENWQEHVLEYTTNCENSYTHYREIVEANSEVIQNALNNIRDTVGDITANSDELADTVLNEVIPAMDTELTQVGKVTEAFAAQRSTIQDLIGYYDALCRQIDTAIYKVQQLNAEKAGEVEGDGTGGGGGGDDLTGSKTPTKNPVNPTNPTSPTESTKISHDEMKQLVTNMMVHGTYGNDPHRTNNILGTGKYTAEDRAAAQKIVNDIAANNSDAWHKGTNWDSVLDSTTKKYGYATGGYTGAWGPEGRLAFLHEKELILNKQDTANFLVATQVLRDIAKMIDINSLHSQISNLTSIGMTSMKADTLEQQVSIEAHFPNVTDKNEIEQALNNLVNTAAQYANRKF